MTQTIQIATRESQLAMVQAHHVGQLLTSKHSDLRYELVAMTTSGDKLQQRTLDSVGGKGLFLKELEESLIRGETDIAVHSMKDVPISLDQRFQVASVGKRDMPNDVVVSNHEVSSIGSLGIVGTASARRKSLLKHVYRHISIENVRGNVQTRLRKLDDKAYDALVLAAAGLHRLALQDRISHVLPTDMFIPAAGQGVLGVEYLHLRDDLAILIQSIQDDEVEARTIAERRVAEILGADCAMAFGAYCERKENLFVVYSIVLSASGDRAIRASSSHADAECAAEKVARRLLDLGATDLIST